MTTVRLKTTLFAFILLAMPFRAVAQVGEYRNEFSVGGGVGVALNSVGFTPRVPQGMHIGPTAGVTARYVCEKYYSMICSIVAEVNYTSLGWKEIILDAYDQKVINPVTGNAEEYSRTITYLQVPIFAHLAWGKEHSGCNFFFRAGPQLGVMLGESTSANFNISGQHAGQGELHRTSIHHGCGAEVRLRYCWRTGNGVFCAASGAFPARRALLLWVGQHLQ